MKNGLDRDSAGALIGGAGGTTNFVLTVPMWIVEGIVVSR